jgi:AcrR family transcriptional regulator
MASRGPATARSKRRESRERSRRRIIEAASELVRERSYAELNVGEIMERAGIGRTLFYRHFDDLGDLLLDVAQEAMDELYETQVELAAARLAATEREIPDPAVLREAIEVPVAVYSRHGPLLRAVIEAAAADPVVAERVAPLRERFDELVAELLERAGEQLGNPPANATESARALNRLIEGYLVDVFGRVPRVTPEVATETLMEIWLAFVTRPAGLPTGR